MGKKEESTFLSLSNRITFPKKNLTAIKQLLDSTELILTIDYVLLGLDSLYIDLRLALAFAS